MAIWAFLDKNGQMAMFDRVKHVSSLHGPGMAGPPTDTPGFGAFFVYF